MDSWRRPSLACDFKTIYHALTQALEGPAPTHPSIFANDFDTMYSLFNPTDRAQDFIATIYYGDGSGSYQMPVHLGAQASTMIDMTMLIGEKRPDVHGNVIPPSVQQGSVVFESAKGKAQWITLVVSGGVYNPRRGTCGYLTCISCYGYTNPVVVLTPFSVGVQNTLNEYAQATYSDGTVQDFTSSSSWSSQSTSVMTVGSSTGLVTGVSLGSTNITVQFPTLVVTASQICSTYTPTCPTFAPAPQSGGTTTPYIDHIFPTLAPANQILPVTIYGRGFGTCPSVQAGTGITVSVDCSTSTTTQLNTTFTVAAIPGNATVTVTAATIKSNPAYFYVQIPTSVYISTFFHQSETACTVQGMAGCGSSDQVKFLVQDQIGQTITFPLFVYDVITVQAKNDFGYCTADQQNCQNPIQTTCPNNSGPCAVKSNSYGEILDNKSTCSTDCINNSVCIIPALESDISQVWHAGGFPLAPVSDVFKCNQVTANGQ